MNGTKRRTSWFTRRASCSVRNIGLERRNEGFTLIEILISIAVLSLIISALAGATLLGVHLSSSAGSRLNESTDAQISGAWFARDVRAASTVTVAPTTHACAADPAFATSGPGVAKDLVDIGQPNTDVSYYYGEIGKNWSLVRTAGSGSSCTSPRYIPIARSLSSTTAPVVQCGIPASACASGTQTPTTSMSIAITETDGYTYSLTGVPRIGIFGEPSLSSLDALLVLGTGADALELGPKGSASLTVTGNIVVNSSSTDAIYIGGSGSINISGGTISYLNGATCVANKGSTPCTVPTYVSSAITTQSSASPDPYNDSSFVLPTPPPYGCVWTKPTTACTSYSGTNVSGVIQPGIYTSQITVPNGDDVTFASGTYILEGGIDLDSDSVATSQGGGVFLYVGCPAGSSSSCGPNQLSDANATVTISNGAVVNLSAPSSGLYNGILLFQARDDSSEIDLEGGASASSLNGVIYAPDALVYAKNGASMTLYSVISESFQASGSVPVILGG